MRKNIEIVYENLNQGKALVMATILSKQGSAPRSAGTKMFVHRDGHTSGTIGGGWVEGQVQKLAKDFFKTQKGAVIHEFTLDSKAYVDMDMVCGGDITLLIEYLPATSENIELFSGMLEIVTRKENGFMVSRLTKKNSETFEMERFLVSDKKCVGAFEIQPETVTRLAEQTQLMRSPGIIKLDGESFFVEPAQFSGTLYILGAGHLAVETAKLAFGTGFKIIVMDDRREFASEERFPMAEVHVVDNFNRCFDNFFIGEEDYIVIMTRGHLHDEIILEQALKTHAAYIGMIGSKSKKKTIYDHLLSRGISQARLDTIYAPIGLSIGAQTPQEIAVSIVAELIQVRFQG